MEPPPPPPPPGLASFALRPAHPAPSLVPRPCGSSQHRAAAPCSCGRSAPAGTGHGARRALLALSLASTHRRQWEAAAILGKEQTPELADIPHVKSTQVGVTPAEVRGCCVSRRSPAHTEGRAAPGASPGCAQRCLLKSGGTQEVPSVPRHELQQERETGNPCRGTAKFLVARAFLQ